MKFEYKIIEVNGLSDLERNTDNFNELGEQGWELIEIFEEATSRSTEIYAVFKRQK